MASPFLLSGCGIFGYGGRVDRVSAARERLEAVKLVVRQAGEAGPPCFDCRYRTWLGMCGSPAYAEPKFDPVTGEYAEEFSTPVAKARAADGLCGSEALLFEPLLTAQLIAQVVARSIKPIWLISTGIVSVGFVLFFALAH